MKCSSKMLHNLLHFWNMIADIGFFVCLFSNLFPPEIEIGPFEIVLRWNISSSINNKHIFLKSAPFIHKVIT